MIWPDRLDRRNVGEKFSINLQTKELADIEVAGFNRGGTGMLARTENREVLQMNQQKKPNKMLCTRSHS